MTVLTATNLSVAYGDVEIFSDVNLRVDDSARIGIVGPNAAGKTTLLKLLVGDLEPDTGTVHLTRSAQLGYVAQHPTWSSSGTIKDELMSAFGPLLALEQELEDAARAIQNAANGEGKQAENHYAGLLERFERQGGYTYANDLERVAFGVGLSRQHLDLPAATASGGEGTRAALAKALLTQPDLLVLDEPTNYLDLKGLTWLEGFLAHYPKALLIVSHDRYFLDRVVTEIWEVNFNRIQSYRGNYTKFRQLREEQRQRQQREYEQQREFIESEESFIRRYRAGQRAREAKGRARRLERLDRLEAPQSDTSVNFSGFASSRTARMVLQTEDLEVGFRQKGQEKKLLSVADFKLERGSRTAVLGNNGAGKTTLIRTLLGEAAPLAGHVFVGEGVQVGYYSQDTAELPQDSTVLDAFLDAKNLPLGEARSYLARFLFTGDEPFQSVDSLSGGQRARLALARLLILEPNLLVLDEPTTHLDIPTREALEEVLLSFDGTLLFVSHDRQLVSRIADQILFAEDGRLTLFRGNYEEWVKQSIQNEAAEQTKTRTPRQRTRVNPPNPQRKPKVTSSQKLEREILELEELLESLEQRLQKASELQDLEAIAALGLEHADTKVRLEERWAQWAD